jgi:hypothetical protein
MDIGAPLSNLIKSRVVCGLLFALILKERSLSLFRLIW